MADSSHPTIEAYMHQYALLSDEALCQIVRGDVPWVDSGKYTYYARTAAYRVLKERGVQRLPRLPRYDPERPDLPWSARMGILCGVVCVGALLTAFATWTSPAEMVSDAEVCTEARELLETTDFALQYSLRLPDCRVMEPNTTRPEQGVRTPIRFDACIELLPRHLESLRSASPLEIAILRRFVPNPVPGLYCPEGGVVLARRVQQKGRPWQVEIALLETQ